MLAAPKNEVVPSELVSHDLIERVLEARRRSDALFAVVSPNSLYDRPIPERHRIIFYVGHLEAFDWNLLNGGVFGMKSVDSGLDRLFAFGIDPIGGGLPTDVPSDWPALDAVRGYVDQIRGALDANLEKLNLDPDFHPHLQSRDSFPLNTLLNVAVEHRLMHLETLAYMLHQLPLESKVRQPNSLSMAGPPIAERMIAIPAGEVTLGLERSGEEFGWDNEYEAHTVSVPAFEIDRYKVTNRQYLAFMADGGYETRAYWNDDDWNWKTTRGISHPLFWRREGNQSSGQSSSGQASSDHSWLWRTMFDEIPLPLDWPVYVSQAEASAYARWAGKSLPSEAEWQRAAYGSVNGDHSRLYPWGSQGPSPSFGNFDFQRWDPMPVNASPRGRSAFGVDDMLGNGWEWTSTTFAPFPGFRPFPFYRGYSADFFDGKHFVMKGGSARTAACMLRSTFRNWFQAHYQYVYAGFRCVSR